MKILVCISKSPDTTAKIAFTDNNTKFATAGVQWIINPYDEWYALVRAIELKEKDSAVSRLKTAIEYTKLNEEKARYRFILGQLFEQKKQPDSAYKYYEEVIQMRLKSPRMYVLQAHGRQAAQFDYKNGDTLAFVEKYKKLLKDRDNRPYLDVINYQLAEFYNKREKTPQALKYYNKSLDAQPVDAYLNASNYRNIAEIYFNDAKYVKAGMYYDSTLVHLKPRTREFRLIEKKRENLEDVIKYESIAQTNDSIIRVFKMSPEAKIAYYNDYIAKLKIEDEKRAKLEEAERKRADIAAGLDLASADAGTGIKTS
ncbi:MAG: hypothetical protein EOP48_19105, partial [Sphingobacteriales bacterium]